MRDRGILQKRVKEKKIETAFSNGTEKKWREWSRRMGQIIMDMLFKFSVPSFPHL